MNRNEVIYTRYGEFMDLIKCDQIAKGLVDIDNTITDLEEILKLR